VDDLVAVIPRVAARLEARYFSFDFNLTHSLVAAYSG